MVSRRALQILHHLISVNPAKLQQFFKDREVVDEGIVSSPLVIRLDGVGFSKVLNDFKKPRDVRVHEALVNAGKALMRRFNGVIAYVASDEVNIALREVPYGGRVFKLVSVSASITSAHVSLSLGRPLYFDSRIIKLRGLNELLTYLLYRLRVCSNNYLSQLYHSSGGRALTPSARDMLSYLIERGLLEGVEDWEVLGSCIYWGFKVKLGLNPILSEKALTVRRYLVARDDVVACIDYLKSLTISK